MLDFGLKGKVALVTGATQGLGYTLARGLASQGATLIISARNREKLDSALERLQKEGFEVRGYLFDVTNQSEIDAAISNILSDFGAIDILVNNAGIQYRAPLEEFPGEMWDTVINTNLSSIYRVSKAVAPIMIRQQSGKIINICSLMSEVARNSISAYTAAKGGVKMLTRSMATEWARHNIQVNGIGPGYFKTEMTDALVKDQQFSDWLCKRTPAGRWGNPEELLGLLVFLASGASSFINGQVIYVDGGILATI
ncbi:MAG: SDR family oxidoreductase [Bacteroidales bacterium]|nr:SDR family oxidoreductase [Bacteroidales bacterium]